MAFSVGFIFWLLIILAVIFHVVWGFRSTVADHFNVGGSFLLFVLILLLGYTVYGLHFTR